MVNNYGVDFGQTNSGLSSDAQGTAACLALRDGRAVSIRPSLPATFCCLSCSTCCLSAALSLFPLSQSSLSPSTSLLRAVGGAAFDWRWVSLFSPHRSVSCLSLPARSSFVDEQTHGHYEKTHGSRNTQTQRVNEKRPEKTSVLGDVFCTNMYANL